MTKTQKKVRSLLERGITDPAVIARKLGYKGSALTAGIVRVKQIIEEVKPDDVDRFLAKTL